jgi:hypothetical protein
MRLRVRALLRLMFGEDVADPNPESGAPPLASSFPIFTKISGGGRRGGFFDLA